METLVTALLLSVVFTAGSMVFVSGERLWSVVSGQIQLQENARQAIEKISAELRESGRNSSGIRQVWGANGAGPNNSDILRFSIPICLCGQSVLNENADVRTWAAPMTWGSTGCTENYTLTPNGKVKICHLPPGNPSNSQTIKVAPSAVKAHLAHGDWLGKCNDCNPTVITSKFVEYRITGNGELLRRTLDSNLVELTSVPMARNIEDLQVFSDGFNKYTFTLTFSTRVYPGRTITFTRKETVLLRNY